MSKSLKIDPYCQRRRCSLDRLAFGNVTFMGDDARYLYSSELLVVYGLTKSLAEDL